MGKREPVEVEPVEPVGSAQVMTAYLTAMFVLGEYGKQLPEDGRLKLGERMATLEAEHRAAGGGRGAKLVKIEAVIDDLGLGAKYRAKLAEVGQR